MMVHTKVRPWNKELIVSRHGDPVVVSPDTFIYYMVKPLLAYAPKGYKVPDASPEETMLLDIDPELVAQVKGPVTGHLHLPAICQRQFEKTIDVVFKREAMQFVKHETEDEEISIMRSFKRFCNGNNITYSTRIYNQLKNHQRIKLPEDMVIDSIKNKMPHPDPRWAIFRT